PAPRPQPRELWPEPRLAEGDRSARQRGVSGAAAPAGARAAPAGGSPGGDRRDDDLAALDGRPRLGPRVAPASVSEFVSRRIKDPTAGLSARAHAPRARGGGAHAAARALLARAAPGGDDLVLDEPLQRVPGQSQRARAGRRLRGARDPAARARALRRAARRGGAPSGDAGLPRQL